MRTGFSLLTAIIFLVVVATISMLALTLSTQSAKQTTDNYIKTQAELLSESATEYALLAMSGHDYSTDCLETIDIKYPSTVDYTLEANVSIMYIGNSLPCTPSHILDDNISTPDSNRTVIIDTFVTSNPAITTEQIRIHRRTIQKP